MKTEEMTELKSSMNILVEVEMEEKSERKKNWKKKNFKVDKLFSYAILNSFYFLFSHLYKENNFKPNIRKSFSSSFSTFLEPNKA